MNCILNFDLGCKESCADDAESMLQFFGRIFDFQGM